MDSAISRKICAVMNKFPELTSPNLLEQVEILEKMGFYLRIISLHAQHNKSELSSLKRLRSQIFYLSLSLPETAAAFFTIFLLMLITPIRTSKAIAGFIKCLWIFKDKLTVVKNFFQAVIIVNQHIINKEISHIHSHCSLESTRTAWFASIISKLPLSFTALPGEIYDPQFQKLHFLIRRAEFILTLSQYDQQRLTKTLIAQKTTVPSILCYFNGINLETFHLRERITKVKAPYRFCTTASLTSKKGLDLVLRALCILKQNGLDFSYRIIGDGPERKQLEQLTSELQIAENVIFTGLRPRHEIPGLLQNSDVFLIAPQTLENGERDSLPAGAIEAMATGVPVISTKSEAITELIEHEETGLIAEASPESLAEACMTILQDHELRQMIIIKARLQIEGSYNIYQQARNLNDFIRTHKIPF
jgi:glycosyltransferase involved in cell wall biosynthesis